MPFTGINKWKYIFFFTLSPGANVVHINKNGKTDFDEQAKHFSEEYLASNPSAKTWAAEAGEYAPPIRIFWNITRNLTKGNIANWNKVLRKHGIDAVVDYGKGIIHGNEPIQAVILNPTIIKPVHKILSSLEKTYLQNKKGVLDFYDDDNINQLMTTKDQSMILKGVLSKSLSAIKAVAQNPNTPTNVLKKFLSDRNTDYIIIYKILSNPAIDNNIIDIILDNMSKDYYHDGQEPGIINTILKRPDLPFESFKKILNTKTNTDSTTQELVKHLIMTKYFNDFVNEKP
jgi:hypothetical protein